MEALAANDWDSECTHIYAGFLFHRHCSLDEEKES